MNRDLSRLAGGTHDLLVVGGGIHGACIAWDAALRGLQVALVERDDFGAATSANSLRIVHGGLRYLARGDLRRMRESIRERSALLRIAPGLVEPLPVLVPTTGPWHPQPARPGRRPPPQRPVLPRSQPRPRRRPPRAGRPPGLAGGMPPPVSRVPRPRRDGGALWHDARLTHPERLDAGLRARRRPDVAPLVANYCEV